MSLMDDITASRIRSDYVCSHCYGDLTEKFSGTRLSDVFCEKCGDVGFVRREYTERRRQESLSEKLEVKYMLQDLGVIQKPANKTTDELLDELGF